MDKGDEDFYESDFVGGQWLRGCFVCDLNISKDEGMSIFVWDGWVLFYIVCGREGVFGGCDIWQVEMD